MARPKNISKLLLGTSLALFFSLSTYSQGFNDFYDSFFGALDILPSENIGRTTFPILSTPSGGRREALGTAFTALADNSTYIESNPAGSAILDFTELSIFHNNLIADVSVESLVFTLRQRDLGLGIGLKFLHLPFTSYGSRGEQLASAVYSEGVVTINGSYNLFSNFYFGGLSLGVNVKLGYRSIPATLYREVTGLEGVDQSAIGFIADLGMLTRFNFLKGYTARDKNFSLGAALLNVGPLVKNEALPTRFTFGIGYRPLRFIQISGDFILPIRFDDPSESESPGFSVGLGIQTTPFLAIQTGFLLIGGNPRLTLGTEILLDVFSLNVNYTLDRTTQIGKIDRFSFQLGLNLGDGGRLTLRQRVDALYLQALRSLADSNFTEVIALCEQTLDLDPGFTPAIETLKTARESYELEQELERLRRDN
ncbi:MAG: UPF0164 family protein [Spirochaetales bacterium]|nr:UPF0164 family protein [Spirochaetales bacterium]